MGPSSGRQGNKKAATEVCVNGRPRGVQGKGVWEIDDKQGDMAPVQKGGGSKKRAEDSGTA